ncbi:DUF3558 family protein [Streptomyces sp. ID05-26A]|nr:DUF3558 family protein [Streptomyces sp. ID05-26A]
MNRLLPAVLAGAFALSGCSTLLPGSAPKPTQSPAPAQPAAQTSEDQEAVEWPEPCELYNAAEELTAYEFKLARDLLYSCDWSQDLGYGKTNVLSVSVWQGLSLDRVPASASLARSSEITVGTHSGKLSEGNEASALCDLALVAGDGHVSVSVRAQDVQESCDIAKQVAEKIEPDLS